MFFSGKGYQHSNELTGFLQGTGPTNPINLDDFNEKTISLITGEMNPHTAQLV